MKRQMKILIMIIAFSGSSVLWAQARGKVAGKVIENQTGDAMFGVVVIHRASGTNAQTDFNGKYLISVPAGKQVLEFRMAGYPPQRLTVNVPAGGVKRGQNVALRLVQAKTEVVVTAKRVTNTAAALLSKRKKAAAAQDAISAEQIAKSPDSDAADAAKRVTGITIFGGQFIFVRGLPERYSSIQVNRAIVPSPLPNKRVVPLDVFPVSLLDDLTIAKTYTPDMPGDFAGGLIGLNTKAYPEKEQLTVGIGTGYNDRATFKTFQTFDGGGLDFFGFNDGTYTMPKDIKNSSTALTKAGLTAGYTNAQLQAFTNDFTNILNIDKGKGKLPGSLSVSYGNQFGITEIQKLGVMVAASFKESSRNRNGVFRQYEPGSDIGTIDYTYEESTYSTTTTGQLTAAYAPTKSDSLKVVGFYTHGSEKRARINDGRVGGGTTGQRHVLRYAETDLIFSQLLGEHVLPSFFQSKVEWFGAYSIAKRDQPDTRIIDYGPTGQISIAEPVKRYFNDFSEQNIEAGPSIEIPFRQWQDLKSKVKIGTFGLLRTRENRSRRFRYTDDANTAAGVNPSQDIESFINQTGYLTLETTGTSSTQGFDAYDATLTIGGGYGMVDIPLMRELRLITGARVESWEQKIDSFNPFDKSTVVTSKIADTDVMPSANLIYSLTKDINIRSAFSQTINRPDFIEASNFRYFDDLETGGIIIGNPNLKKATIQNYDLRFEWFPAVGEVIAISGFYKQINDPIEATINVIGGDAQYGFTNQQKAQNFGGEIEFRKSLGFITDYAEDYSFLANYTIVQSEITIDPSLAGQLTDTERPLQGQSPWVVNVGFFYDNDDWGTNASLLFNMFGRRISAVGTDNLPNIYEESYPTLDFTVAQEVFKGARLKFAASNLLDPEITQNQGSGAEKRLIQRYRRGIDFSLGLRVNI